MGAGVPIQPIKCANYYDAEHVDKEFLYYLREGLIPLTNEMATWGWFWFFPYMYSQMIQEYFDEMRNIILCSIGNNVEDSKFGNQEYLDKVFDRHYDELYDIYFYYADTMWAPFMRVAMYILTDGFSQWLYLGLSVYYMFRWDATLKSHYCMLEGLDFSCYLTGDQERDLTIDDVKKDAKKVKDDKVDKDDKKDARKDVAKKDREPGADIKDDVPLPAADDKPSDSVDR